MPDSDTQTSDGAARTYRKAFFREEALQARRSYIGNQFAPRRRKAVIISVLFLTLCLTVALGLLARSELGL